MVWAHGVTAEWKFTAKPYPCCQQWSCWDCACQGNIEFVPPGLGPRNQFSTIACLDMETFLTSAQIEMRSQFTLKVNFFSAGLICSTCNWWALDNCSSWMSMGGVHLGFYAMSRLLKAPLWSMFICKRQTAHYIDCRPVAVSRLSDCRELATN